MKILPDFILLTYSTLKIVGMLPSFKVKQLDFFCKHVCSKCSEHKKLLLFGIQFLIPMLSSHFLKTTDLSNGNLGL